MGYLLEKTNYKMGNIKGFSSPRLFFSYKPLCLWSPNTHLLLLNPDHLIQ